MKELKLKIVNNFLFVYNIQIEWNLSISHPHGNAHWWAQRLEPNQELNLPFGFTWLRCQILECSNIWMNNFSLRSHYFERTRPKRDTEHRTPNGITRVALLMLARFECIRPVFRSTQIESFPWFDLSSCEKGLNVEIHRLYWDSPSCVHSQFWSSAHFTLHTEYIISFMFFIAHFIDVAPLFKRFQIQCVSEYYQNQQT